MNVHVEARGQTCCRSLCWSPFFLGGEGKSRVYCVCVRACAVEAAWKSQDEFNGVNMYMNAEHQFNIGV